MALQRALVVTTRPGAARASLALSMDVTTVADDLVVLHNGAQVRRFEELAPDHDYELDGATVHTLARPPGELLARFGTVNDVHFGEFECGRIDASPLGPILHAPEGAEPYPLTMNRAVVEELDEAQLDAVVVKGDLTNSGQPEEFNAFADCYRRFGESLHVIRGNHDGMSGHTAFAGDRVVDLPGVRLVLLDTVRPGLDQGWLHAQQLEWLDAVVAAADTPVLVFGHHHPWLGGPRRSDRGSFGIHPDASIALVEVMARRQQIAGYLAGHTHRNRVRYHSSTGAVPYVEVACVKDFPGSWAEYRVYEGAIMQIHHRISGADALAWSERCRVLYSEFGVDYSTYAMGTLADRCFVMPTQ
jgi:predicted phosphodiesterase